MKKTNRLVSVVSLQVALFVCVVTVLSQSNLDKETVIVQNTEHVVAYSIKDDNLVIIMEAIKDFTDETRGKWPLVDFMSIEVDKNGNGTVDTDVDIAYAVGKSGICTQFLVAVDGSSACGVLRSKASLEVDFRSSLRESKPHPVFRFVIPKTEVHSGKRSPGFVFQFHSSEKISVYYPNRQEHHRRSFAETIRLNID